MMLAQWDGVIFPRTWRGPERNGCAAQTCCGFWLASVEEAHPSNSLDGEEGGAHRRQKHPSIRVLDTERLWMGADGDSAGRDDCSRRPSDKTAVGTRCWAHRLHCVFLHILAVYSQLRLWEHVCECESLSLSENPSFFARLQTGPRPRRPSPSGIIPVNIRLYALQLYGRVPYNWGIFLARGRENAAFDCLHTTERLNCISLVRSWSDPAEGVNKRAWNNTR